MFTRKEVAKVAVLTPIVTAAGFGVLALMCWIVYSCWVIVNG